MIKQLNWAILVFFISFLGCCTYSNAVLAKNLEDFVCYSGTPVVDGVIHAKEYSGSPRVFYKRYRMDSRIKVYLNYDDTYIYMGINVLDDKLYADGPGNTWDTHVDDDVEWYLDPQNNRGEYLQADDAVWAMKLNYGGRLDKGNGSGGASNKLSTDFPGPVLTGVSYVGTLNDASDTDTSYTMETAIPWSVLQTSRPNDGDVWGMNFLVIEDDDGGGPDFSYTEAAYDIPHVMDEITALYGDGMKGPDNWPDCVFSDATDTTPPSGITSLTALSDRSRSAELNFYAPGDNGSTGVAYAYEIRYSTTAISSELDWIAATVYANNFVPKEPGQSETLKVFGLTPGVTYHFAVRAVDERGNKGAINNAATVTTPAEVKRSTNGRVFVGPMGRSLIHENGEPFHIIGHHVSAFGTPFASFYDGPLGVSGWNVYEEWGGFQRAADYIQERSAEGKNTLRIFLEDLHQLSLGIPPEWAGLIEWPSTTDGSGINASIIQYLHNLFGEAEKADMYIAVTMYDTFFYPDYFNQSPLYIGNGGPMSSVADFFKPAYYPYHKARLKALAEVGKEYDSLLFWEIANEYDGPWGDDTDLTTREAWLKEMSDYIRTIDPNHMVLTSSAKWVYVDDAETFPYKDVDTFDLWNLHQYPLSMSNPVANPDTDKSIRPALEINRHLKAHFSRMSRHRAIIDGEFGPEYLYVQSYSDAFTYEQDVQMTHNVLWAEIASGLAGAGLRTEGTIVGGEFPEEMSALYNTVAAYFDYGGIDWNQFAGTPWDDDMDIDAGSKTIYIMGFSDGLRGTGWLLNDTRVDSGSVDNASLTIKHLDEGRTYTIEFWDTYDDTATSPMSISTVYSSNGEISAAVPSFTRDIALKWYLAETAPKGKLNMSSNVLSPGQTLIISSGVEAGDDVEYDEYVALILPSGHFFTLTGANSFSNVGEVAAVLEGARGDSIEKSVLYMSMPSGLPGDYTIIHLLTPPGDGPDFSNIYYMNTKTLTVLE